MHSRFPGQSIKALASRAAICGLGFIAAFSGCAQPARDNYAVIRSGDRIGDSKDPAYQYHYPATAPLLNADELKRFVEQHRNQVVVLEFWASWSSSSRDQIARLARLHADRRSDGLRVIACTFDEPREWRTHTVPVLHSAGANYPCVVVPLGARQALSDWLDPNWRFDVPARFVVDRQGTEITRAFGEGPILAALDSWGSGGSRRRPSYESDRSLPEDRPLRVATASHSEAGIDDAGVDTTAEPSRSYSSRSRAADAPAARTTSREPVKERYASSRRSTSTTRRSSARRYESARTSPPAATREATSSTRKVRTATGPASTRVKLVNIRTGESEWLPVVARDEGLTAAADAVATAVRNRVGRSANPRIAVMPLSSMRNRNYATPLGREAADSIVASLKREGYYDLVKPARAERMVKDAGVTATQIDFDATVVKNKIDADYLVFGWVRNDVDEMIRAQNVTRFAGDAGGIDDGYVAPRREAEDFLD